MWQFSSLAGKVALVTGASRGIGRACAQHLAQMGATIVGTATSVDGAQQITEYLAQQGLIGQGLVLDVTQPQMITDVLSEIEAQMGAPSILINNAGITRDNLLLRMKEDEWNAVLDANLSSAYRLSKACLRHMLKAKWGRIISISSVVGSMGNAGQANYAASKAGLMGFSKSLAREVASRGITVNVVAPGFIETQMTQNLNDEQREGLIEHIPTGTLGKPQDVAVCVGFLASSEAHYITGETLHVNGGMLMC